MTTDKREAEIADARLLDATARNSEAFGQFYDHHVDDVLAYFFRRTACTHTAADLTAETFAQALRSAHRYRTEQGVPRAWLFGIAKNILSHYQRHQRVSDRSLRKLGMQATAEIDLNLERVDARVDAHFQIPALTAALAQMPSSMAEAVVLRIGQNLEFTEVAAALGCSVGAARVRVSRGLTQLAETVHV